MGFPIIQQIRDYLQRHGPASVQKVAEAIPELETCGGEQRAFLLMRLDPHLEPVKANQWAFRCLLQPDELEVRESAEKYFASIKRPGAPLSSVIQHIHRETQIEPSQVCEILAKYYVLHGSNIFNRKRKEEP
ncbi:MAG: hypothetical protein ABSE08_14820 [Syntrophobacteraceae bacterium]|jgi:hypothetical protein